MPKLKYILFFLLFSLFGNLNSKSQTITDPELKHSYITVRLHKGIVVPHHATMKYFIDDFSNGFEINYGRNIFSEDSWESYFNYPEIGMGFYYGTFGNKDVFGSGIALFPYINYKIIRTPSLSIHNKVAMGLGYATNPFDVEDNIYNTVFSSHLNVYIGFALLMDYRLNDHFSLSLSGSLTHLSNGAARKPNHGVNTLTASLGTRYHFNTNRTPTIKRNIAPKSDMREVLIIGSSGRSQSTRYNQQKFWNGSLSINHLWYLSPKRAIGIGFDQFYSETAPYTWDAYENPNEVIDFNSKYYFFSGLFASYNVFLGKTTLFVNLGTYLHTYTEPPQPVYPRLGIRRLLTNNLVANFSVKASFFRSEFLEFGLGYRFNYQRKRKS